MSNGREIWLQSLQKGTNPRTARSRYSSNSKATGSARSTSSQRGQSLFLKSLIADDLDRTNNSSRPTTRRREATDRSLMQAYGMPTSSSLAAPHQRTGRAASKAKHSNGRQTSSADEDHREQVYELRKQLQLQKKDINTLKGRVNVLKAQLQQKDKHLDHVIEESLQDAAMTGTTRPIATNVHLIASLKNKIHEAEERAAGFQAQAEQAAEKVRFTRIEEIELEVTTYYNEVLRLRTLLKEKRAGHGVVMDSSDAPEELQQLKHELTDLKFQLQASESENTRLNEEVAAERQRADDILADLGGDEEGSDEYAKMNRKDLLEEARALDRDLEKMKRRFGRAKTKSDEFEKKYRSARKQYEAATLEIAEKKQEIQALKKNVAVLEGTNSKLTGEISRMANVSTEDLLAPIVARQEESMKSYMDQIKALQPLIENQTSAISKKLDTMQQNDEKTRELQQKHANLLVDLPKDPYSDLNRGADEEKLRKKKAKKTKKKRGTAGDTDNSSSSGDDDEDDEDGAKAKTRPGGTSQSEPLSEQERIEGITTLQSIFRGHAARKRIVGMLKERKWEAEQQRKDKKRRLLREKKELLGRLGVTLNENTSSEDSEEDDVEEEGVVGDNSVQRPHEDSMLGTPEGDVPMELSDDDDDDANADAGSVFSSSSSRTAKGKDSRASSAAKKNEKEKKKKVSKKERKGSALASIEENPSGRDSASDDGSGSSSSSSSSDNDSSGDASDVSSTFADSFLSSEFNSPRSTQLRESDDGALGLLQKPSYSKRGNRTSSGPTEGKSAEIVKIEGRGPRRPPSSDKAKKHVRNLNRLRATHSARVSSSNGAIDDDEQLRRQGPTAARGPRRGSALSDEYGIGTDPAQNRSRSGKPQKKQQRVDNAADGGDSTTDDELSDDHPGRAIAIEDEF